MRLRMSTKHGKHGQWVTLWKWLNFDVDPDPDVDLGSVFHFNMDMDILYDILSLTRGRHCSGVGGVCTLCAHLVLI